MGRMAQAGGAVLVLAGVLHMSAFGLVGWNSLTAQLLPIGMLYVALGALTVAGRRGMMWLAAIASGLGLIAAVEVMPTPYVPSALMWCYIILDVIVIFCLSLSISKSSKPLSFPSLRGDGRSIASSRRKPQRFRTHSSSRSAVCKHALVPNS